MISKTTPDKLRRYLILRLANSEAYVWSKQPTSTTKKVHFHGPEAWSKVRVLSWYNEL